MTLDGRGERATTGYALGDGNRLEWLGQVHMPHSLGMLYEQVTEYLGFLHSSDEYKVMALASYGKPRYWPTSARSSGSGTDGEYTIEPNRLEERFGPARSGADRWSRSTTTSPTRCRWSWRRRCSSWRAGCTGRRGATTSAWQAASR